MTVAVVCEQRFWRNAAGEVFTRGPSDYVLWRRYLAVFDNVRVVARVGTQADAEPAGTRADGPGVGFWDVPCYRGPWQFLCRLAAIRRSLRQAAGCDALILRVPSVLASQLEPCLKRRGQRFAVEVLGDPWDALAPGAHPHPLREFFRRRLAADLRRQCAASGAALYVTARALQRRYPPNPAAISVACSDVHLPPEAFVPAPRSSSAAPRPARLITVGSLDHLYKAPDVLIDAVALCREQSLDARLTIVGGGCHQAALRERAASRGIGAHVCFRGPLCCREDIRRELDSADLFVLPSRQEGLPRALLEAMARALPAIGSTAGGIPELLDAGELTAVSDARALAMKIRELIASPRRLSAQSARNLEVARGYRQSRLEQDRDRFLRGVRALVKVPAIVTRETVGPAAAEETGGN